MASVNKVIILGNLGRDPETRFSGNNLQITSMSVATPAYRRSAEPQVRGEETLLSTPDSRVALWLIPTNEELMIARDAYRLLDFS